MDEIRLEIVFDEICCDFVFRLKYSKYYNLVDDFKLEWS